MKKTPQAMQTCGVFVFGRRNWTRTNDPHHVNGGKVGLVNVRKRLFSSGSV